MCGITGFFNKTSPDRPVPVIEGMTNALRHRGPDDQGVWFGEGGVVALGHRRLSVLDLSLAGRQPMHSESGRYSLVFNGEIYNHQQLRTRLEAAVKLSPQWRGHSDTETLLACIEAWGLEETLREARGMFALAVWDSDRGSLLLARDRMGEKPLYYGWQGDTFLFGSELKALKAHPAFHADVDRGALALYLRHNYVPAPYSIYQGIYKLPAGTFLDVGGKQKRSSPAPYWQLSGVAEQGTAQLFQGSDADATNHLEHIMLDAVRGQMLADVPLGALLSGGIDSSVVCALMQANSEQAVNTFTIGFSESHYNEAEHARAVAKHLGTHHTELYVSAEDALALVPELPDIWDEPFADSSQLPTYLVMQLARRHVTVALSGDGGDELFAGYNRHRYAPRLKQQLGWMPDAMLRGIGSVLTAVPAPLLNKTLGTWAGKHGISLPGDKAHKLGQKLRQVNFGDVDELYVSLMTEWADPAAVLLEGYIPTNLLDNRDGWPKLESPVARMMVLDGLVYLPDDILVKLDRAAMAVSLETRAPFLDCNVIEFAWSLPMHMKQRGVEGKWLLRQLLDRYVPRELIERPKMGFGIPLDQWLRGPLREWADSLLAEDRLLREGFFYPAPIREAWQKHCSGQENNGHRLWSVLMFQAWLEAQ